MPDLLGYACFGVLFLGGVFALVMAVRSQGQLRRDFPTLLAKPWTVRGDCTWEQHERHQAINAPSWGEGTDMCAYHIVVSSLRYRTLAQAQADADRRNAKYGGQPSQPVWHPVLVAHAHDRIWMG